MGRPARAGGTGWHTRAKVREFRQVPGTAGVRPGDPAAVRNPGLAGVGRGWPAGDRYLRPVPATENDLVVRPAEPGDVARIHKLVRELAAFERYPEAVRLTPQDYLRDGFGPDPKFRVLLAERAGRLEGMAFFYPAYSTWKGPVLWLEDLVVREEARGAGVGRKLFEALAREAVDAGAAQIRWLVLDWNETALGFYRRIGAEVHPEWIGGKMDRPGLERMLAD